MAFSTIQQVLTFLAAQLAADAATLAPDSVGRWRYFAEVSGQVPVVADAEDDVPRVILQAGAPSRAISDSLHRCFSYPCELVILAQPDAAASLPPQLMAGIAHLEFALASVLARLNNSPLVDPVDEVAAAFLVAHQIEKTETAVDDTQYFLKIPFTLILQF